ncbi:MAG: PAS domain S-box protein, partial [Candidatus Limnocylindria bacterium]
MEAKLALVEFLLTCDSLPDCAQRSLEWLAQHAGIKQGVCAVIDGEPPHLVGLSGIGLPAARVRKFSIDLEHREDPLVAALSRTTPTAFSQNGVGGRQGDAAQAPFGAAPFMAIPLYGVEGSDAVPGGLLLVAPLSPGLNRHARWLTEILGHKLVRVRSGHILADSERKLRRERALLYNIINTVTDPIILTDTEGRIIVTNARAENLLAATEGESEGRRRAVALNNMLFSSALSQSALEDAGAARRELLLVDPQEGSDLLFELLSAVASDAREGTGIVSILRNVTDLRRATEEVEENYRKLRAAEAEVRAERDRL